MATHDDFGWHDRAIALASLGAAALSRFAFTPADAGEAVDPQPLEMQVLVALALQDSLAADPPHRTGTDWLSVALRLEQVIVDDIVGRLESGDLVRRSSDTRDEIDWELYAEGDEDVIADLPIGLTDLGFETVGRWLRRTRPHFGGWPPAQTDVDDAVG
jgi:hypothetical protein